MSKVGEGQEKVVPNDEDVEMLVVLGLVDRDSEAVLVSIESFEFCAFDALPDFFPHDFAKSFAVSGTFNALRTRAFRTILCCLVLSYWDFWALICSRSRVVKVSSNSQSSRGPRSLGFGLTGGASSVSTSASGSSSISIASAPANGSSWLGRFNAGAPPPMLSDVDFLPLDFEATAVFDFVLPAFDGTAAFEGFGGILDVLGAALDVDGPTTGAGDGFLSSVRAKPALTSRAVTVR